VIPKNMKKRKKETGMTVLANLAADKKAKIFMAMRSTVELIGGYAVIYFLSNLSRMATPIF
jgi:hypothetical protein